MEDSDQIVITRAKAFLIVTNYGDVCDNFCEYCLKRQNADRLERNRLFELYNVHTEPKN